MSTEMPALNLLTAALPAPRRILTRRQALWEIGGGLGGVALAALLGSEGLVRGDELTQPKNPLASRPPQFAAKAKRVIQIFCPGGLSHVDTWDYRPELQRRAGKPFDPGGKLQFFGSKPGNCQPSYWTFRQHGQCGRWMSDLFPLLAGQVDEMAFIHSMQSKTALHGPAMFMMNSGFIRPGFPAMGAWVTYGLGSDNDNLPAFVVLPDPRGLPPGGVTNWGAGFLPAVYQATVIETAKGQAPIADLFPAEAQDRAIRARRPGVSREAEHRACRRALGRVAAGGAHRGL